MYSTDKWLPETTTEWFLQAVGGSKSATSTIHVLASVIRSIYRNIAGFTVFWSGAISCLPVNGLCNGCCQPLNVGSKVANIIVFFSLV